MVEVEMELNVALYHKRLAPFGRVTGRVLRETNATLYVFK
jgi:hypothetical protein